MSRPSHAPPGQPTPATPWRDLPAGPHDIRLVVADLDGTLLNEHGAVPSSFWPVLDWMRGHGITFVPASGRQYATLHQIFHGLDDGLSYVAENGNLVVHQGRPVATHGLDLDASRRIIEIVRQAAGAREGGSGRNLGLVVCGLDSAYVERDDQAFLAEARKYYVRLDVVKDLSLVTDRVLKLAVFDFDGAQDLAAGPLAPLADTHQVVVSGQHWVDVMAQGVDKGGAVRQLQQAVGVTPAQTVVFGDYLNDLQMLEAADWSFAMANAHPDVAARARWLAPANTDDGVAAVLRRLFDL
ncbi:Cof-type HAD-IIB family hydrolase [Arthrobacter ginkgonis]|uniref:Cof-type HAD-IIB family hydrolase n=1 Tax=Arthrobacter ginkgonis TaxID=1630594 RepID=A0ABP7CEA9_9MICC